MAKAVVLGCLLDRQSSPGKPDPHGCPIPSACMCTCVSVFIQVQLCTCVYKDPNSISGIIHSLGDIYLVLSDKVSGWSRVFWLGQAGYPASPRDLPVPASPALGFQAHTTTTEFFMWVLEMELECLRCLTG